ncbi:MAG: GNAT family N-acetyltransferase [Spirochaetales bacterium]|jgi:predicted N-acetyltransferase YhbS
MNIVVRNEAEADYRKVEDITRKAFWNLYFPGCNEHYLVHIMRNHKDFIKELALVVTINEKVVGNIMYMKSYVKNENDEVLDTLTFGPVSVHPSYQNQGIGSTLIKKSIEKAKESKYKAIIIYGYPHNYCKHGFKSSKDFNISNKEGKYPYSLLVLELEKDLFKDHSWKYYDSDAYVMGEKKVEEFDKLFTNKEKGYRYSHEEFSIA